MCLDNNQGRYRQLGLQYPSAQRVRAVTSSLGKHRQYVNHRSWTVADEYVDTGWSGATASRPEFDRLLKDARMRRMDAVLVWKLDRWGRSVAASVKAIQEPASLGIRFIAITQNIDTDDSNPKARFLLYVLAAFAELERELMRERVTAGVQAAIARGETGRQAQTNLPANEAM
jgi:putative DNA-invertase from lambdoid prophage Rac